MISKAKCLLRKRIFQKVSPYLSCVWCGVQRLPCIWSSVIWFTLITHELPLFFTHTHTCTLLHTQQQVRHFSKMKAFILAHKLERNPDVKGKNWIVVEINQIETLRECVRKGCFSSPLVHFKHYRAVLFSYFWRILGAVHWSRRHELGTHSYSNAGRMALG